jgi:glycosyltransferase involved in cell wall biosynthesis
MDCEILIVNLEGYGKGGLGTLAYDLHDLLVAEEVRSVLIASGNPRKLPNVSVLNENDYDPVPQLVRKLSARYRLIMGRNELAALSRHLSDLVLVTGGTAYLQDWLEAHPQRNTLDFLRLKHLPPSMESTRINRERLALERATKILSAPGLNRLVLEKAYPEFSHKIFEVPQIFRRIRPETPWEAREIDLIAVAQWKDRGIDRDVKGYRLMAKICNLLRPKNYRTVIVGDVPFPVDGVTHTGWLDHEETLGLMDNARVFVCPSRNECYSQAVVEALQLGCNVVLSRNVEPHGFCHPGLIARHDGRSFYQKVEQALSKRFQIKPLPSPKDSLRLLLSALEA